jgi:hypothetical protein
MRDLAPVKNSEQITNWMWIVVGVMQSESCHFGEIANFGYPGYFSDRDFGK